MPPTCSKEPSLQVNPLMLGDEPNSWGWTHRHTRTDAQGATTTPCSGTLTEATTHTPGPWLIPKDGSYAIRAAGPIGRWEAGQFTVATVGCSSPSPQAVERANQRLIAAAPDLLAVAEAVAESCDDKGLRMQARAAINKAKGAA